MRLNKNVANYTILLSSLEEEKFKTKSLSLSKNYTTTKVQFTADGGARSPLLAGV